MNEYPFIERTISVGIMDDLVATTLKYRARAAYDEMERSLHSPLFADLLYRDRVAPTRWQRTVWPITRVGRRIRDAWQVLTGRAEIDGGW